MNKKNSYIKKNKNATELHSFQNLKTTKCKEKDSGYYYKNIYESVIEQEGNFITIKAYVEKTIDISTETGKKEYTKIQKQQKSPLPNIIRQYEKEAHFDSTTLY